MHGMWWERVEAKVPVGVTVLAALLVLLLVPTEANGNVSCSHEAGVLAAPSAVLSAAPVLAGTLHADAEECPECPAAALSG